MGENKDTEGAEKIDLIQRAAKWLAVRRDRRNEDFGRRLRRFVGCKDIVLLDGLVAEGLCSWNVRVRGGTLALYLT